MDARGILYQTAAELDLESRIDISADDVVEALIVTRPDLAATYRAVRSAWAFEEWANNNQVQGLDAIRAFSRRQVLAFDHEQWLRSFAERVATEPLIPVEDSPVHGISLISLLRKADSAAVVAYSTWTHHPYLLLAIPVGRVIMGGARGIAAGLEEGLYRRIVTRLTGTDPGPPPDELPPLEADPEEPAEESESGEQHG